MDTFFRCWLISGLVTLMTFGIYALTLLPTTDTVGPTVTGIVVAFSGIAGLIFFAVRAGVFASSK